MTHEKSIDPREPAPEALLVHAAFLKRVVRFLVSDGDDVDDVVQEVWVAALRRPPTHKDAARSWLWSVASNVIRLRLRTKVRARARERKLAVSEVAPSIEEIREREAIRSEVLEALLELPPQYREVLLLRFFEELSWRDVAKRLDVPPETARTRAKRARVALRTQMEKRIENRGGSLLTLIPLLELQDGVPLAKWGLAEVIRGVAVASMLVAALWFGARSLFDGDDESEPTLLEAEGAERAAGSQHAGDAEARPGLAGLGRRPRLALAERPAAGRVTIRGRIVDESGAPVRGADVRLGFTTSTLLDDHDCERTSTSAAGTFSLTPRSDDLPLRLVASKSGHAPLLRVIRRSADLGDLTLVSTGRLFVRVLDKTSDSPLSRARVEAVMHRHGQDLIVRKWTDDAGRSAVQLPWAGRAAGRFALRISREGYRPLLLDVSRPNTRAGWGQQDEPRTIYLTPAKGLNLIVLDGDGHPVEGATVLGYSSPHLRNPSGQGAAFIRRERTGVVELGWQTSDGKGRALLQEPPHGHTVLFTAALEDHVAFAVLTRYRARGEEPVALRLQPAVVVHGRVVVGTGEAERGLENAEVALPLAAVIDPVLARTMFRGIALRPLADALQIRTDADGHFSFVGMPIQSHGVTLKVRARHPAHGEAATGLPPEYNAERGLVIRMRAGRSQLVRVQSRGGEPLVGAIVEDPFRSLQAATDAKGEARIALPAKGRMSLHATAPGYARATGTAHGSRDVEILTLSPARMLSGEVVDPSGVGLPVRLVLHRKAASGQRVYLSEVLTGASGRFAFEDAGEGPWVLVAHPANSSERPELRVPATGKHVTFRIDPPGEGAALGTVEGSVHDESGHIVPEYTIILRSRDAHGGGYRPTQSGRRFRFEGVKAGDYELDVRALSRRVRKSIRLDAGAKEDRLRIDLPGWSRIKGRVGAWPSKADERPALVHLRRKGGFRGWQGVPLAAADGSFAFRKLAAGTYELYLSDMPSRRHWLVSPREISVGWGEQVMPELRIYKAARLEITASEREINAAAGTRMSSGGQRVYRGQVLPPPTRPGRTGSASPAAKRNKSTLMLILPDGSRMPLGAIQKGTLPLDEPLEPGRYELVASTPRGELREAFDARPGETTRVDLSVQ